MTDPDDNAFPEITSDIGFDRDSSESYSNISSEGGLTKREYFAGIAMQGLLAKYGDMGDELKCGRASREFADALIKALGEG